MPLEKIIERISSDAQKKASEIESAAKAKAKGILNEGEREAEKLKARLLTEAEKEAEEERKRALALARLETRSLILAAKQEAVKTAFNKALEKLLGFSDKEYQELIKKMLLKITLGDEEVILSTKDRKRLGDEFLKEVNAALVKTGKKGNLALSKETKDFQGGFILRSHHLEINSTFSALLDSVRNELEPAIVKVLFGEAN